jgi:hypothetical protein
VHWFVWDGVADYQEIEDPELRRAWKARTFAD